MRFPFTPDQFLDVFRRYNVAVWPAQWLLALVAVTALFVALRGRPASGRWVNTMLAALWLWMALAYHLASFASVNPAALIFAVAFALQGLLFALLALRGTPASYRPPPGAGRVLGAIVVAYALVIYPALGYVFGHRYPAAPTFGVPCPTTIYTLGLLVWAGRRAPWWVFVIPIAWAAVATSAALQLGMTEDLGLVAAGLATLAWLTLGRGVPGTTVPPQPLRLPGA